MNSGLKKALSIQREEKEPRIENIYLSGGDYMGIIENKSYVKINRPKVYILKYNDHNNIDFFTGSHERIMGYFTSKENADNYVKQLIDNRKYVAVKIGENNFGGDIIRYAPIAAWGIDIKNTINLVIEEHEMDLDLNESSYFGMLYPDIKPEVEMTSDS